LKKRTNKIGEKMNNIIGLVGILLILITIAVCEVHYHVYLDYEKTSEISIIGLVISACILMISILI